jgi:hypothetical protein
VTLWIAFSQPELDPCKVQRQVCAVPRDAAGNINKPPHRENCDKCRPARGKIRELQHFLSTVCYMSSTDDCNWSRWRTENIAISEQVPEESSEYCGGTCSYVCHSQWPQIIGPPKQLYRASELRYGYRTLYVLPVLPNWRCCEEPILPDLPQIYSSLVTKMVWNGSRYTPTPSKSCIANWNHSYQAVSLQPWVDEHFQMMDK